MTLLDPLPAPVRPASESAPLATAAARRRDISGSTAVMAQKRPKISDGQPWQDFELFCTPPFATRALFAHVFPSLHIGRLAHIWDPCAGLGHMSEPLREFCDDVYASDVFNYTLADGRDMASLGVATRDFLSPPPAGIPRFIIANPPFSQAARMARHAFKSASGVAFLLRLQWLETLERYRLFLDLPASRVAVFSERVAMCEGGYDPHAKSATGYAWFVWVRSPYDGKWLPPARAERGAFDGFLIPPDCKRTLSRDSDKRLASRHVPGWIAPSVLQKQRQLAVGNRQGNDDA